MVAWSSIQPRRLGNKLGGWTIAHRGAIVGVALLCATMCAVGIMRIRFCHNMDALFDDGNPHAKALVNYQHLFGDRDNILFTLAPGDGDIFTAATLGFLRELSDAADAMPYASRVYSLPRFRSIRFDGEDILIEKLYDVEDDLTDADLSALRDDVLHEPLLVHQLVSADGSAASVFVRLELPDDNDAAMNTAASAARALLNDFRTRFPGMELHLTGSVMIDQAFRETALRDARTLVPGMFLLVFIIIGITLRSFSGMLAVIIVMAAAVAGAVGFAGWLDIPLSIISSAVPGLIVTLAVADCVHIVNSVFQRMRAGATKEAAIRYAMRVNLKPVFLTSFTTAIGFLSLNFAESPPFRDLGNLIAIGVLSAFLFSALLLPALLAMLPLRVRESHSRDMTGRMHALASLVTRHARVLMIGLLGLGAIIITGVFRLELDTNSNAMYSRKLEVRRATDFHIREMGVFAIIGYPLDSGDAHGVVDPEYLRTIDRFADWYRGQPGVLHVSSVADTIKRINRAMHAGEPEAERIPDCRNTIAQYLLFYGMSLPAGYSLESDVDITHRVSALHVMARPMTSNQIRALDDAAQAWLHANAPASMHTAGSGPSLIWAHLTYRNFRAMIIGTLGALLLISLIITPALRSVRFGLLSIPPNVLPPVMAFGIWGHAVGHVGLPASMIAAMVIGIVVDDTIHFLCRYTRARRIRGMDSEKALHHTFNTVVPALCITSIALVCGFLMLSLSPFGMTSSIGSMSATVIGLALAFDLLLLPPLILTAEQRKNTRSGKPGILPGANQAS